MTREEAINNLNMISAAFVEPVTKEQRKLIDDTFDMAIKALEQEPVLDEIRAEITALPKTYPFMNHIDTYVKEDDVLRIIDKHKAESDSGQQN